MFLFDNAIGHFIFYAHDLLTICISVSIKLLLIVINQREIISSMRLHLSCVFSSRSANRLILFIVHPCRIVKIIELTKRPDIIEGTAINTKSFSALNLFGWFTKVVYLEGLHLLKQSASKKIKSPSKKSSTDCRHFNLGRYNDVHSVSLLLYPIIK